MNEKENHMLEGFKRGRSARDIVTCRQVLNIIVFLGFMVNYMLRVNLTFAIVDMVVKNKNDSLVEVVSHPELSKLNRTIRSLHTFEDLFLEENEYEFNFRNRRLAEPENNLNNYTSLSSNTTELNYTSEYNNQSSETSSGGDNVIRFVWSESQVGYVLGSFFWGYICTEIPGGRLAEVIGTRKVFGYATLGASVITLLAPMSAKISFALLLVNRVAMGMFLGPTWPSILPLASKWIPPDERGKFLSNMMASTLGASFTLPVCGFIIANSSWEYVFYSTGLVGFVWSICWFLLVYDSPAVHPRISDEERFHIESKLGINSMSEMENVIPAMESQVTQSLIRGHERKEIGDTDGSEDEFKTQKDHTSVEKTNFKNGTNGEALSDVEEEHVLRSLNSPAYYDNISNSGKIKEKNVESGKQSHQSRARRAPWISILTSVPVWAFVLTHGASLFGYFSITNQLPTYMKHILNYNIKENGILSGLPYLGKYLSALIGGSTADYLIRSSTLSRNTVRKMFTCLGVMVPGFIMVVQIFLGSYKILSIIIFTLAMVANGFVTGGYLGNSLELAPNYSGTIFGLANMLSGLCGTLSALLFGWLTENNQVYGQWQKGFAIIAVLYIAGALVFLFFGSTKTQPWDSPEEYRSQSNKNRNRNQIRTER